MKDNQTLLAGVWEPKRIPWPVFSDKAVAFLATLSEEILHTPIRQVPEIAAFGFWCRRIHLEQLKKRHERTQERMGRGLVFHIAPSNVPMMFAYTYAIGLLAGNANIVRLSDRSPEESLSLCRVICTVLQRPEFSGVRQRTALIRYPREDVVTARYVAYCDARVVWGGDATVQNLRAMPMPAHAVELTFPDRWSLAYFSQRAMSGKTDDELKALAHRFYNDTYLMDQNACSSPQLIVWKSDGGAAQVRERWWRAVAEEAVREYDLSAYRVARKYERLCLAVMDEPNVARVMRYCGNRLYVASLLGIPEQSIDRLRGGFGFFFDMEVESLGELLPHFREKVQTLCIEGIDKAELIRMLTENHALGIDRIVPLGQAMEMDTIWDGKDLIASLSRMIQ